MQYNNQNKPSRIEGLIGRRLCLIMGREKSNDEI